MHIDKISKTYYVAIIEMGKVPVFVFCNGAKIFNGIGANNRGIIFMSYLKFKTLDDLIEHVKKNTVQVDGEFAIAESVDISDRLEKKTSDHQKSIEEKEALKKRAKDAEAKLKDLEPKVTDYETEIENLRNNNPVDAKVKDLTEKLKAVSTEKAALESRNRDLTEQATRLTEVEKSLSEMTEKEQNRTIVSEIRRIGTELKFPASILGNDILLGKLLGDGVTIDQTTGKVWGPNDTPMKNYLAAKQKEMSDILEPKSAGGGSGPSNGPGKSDTTGLVDRFNETKNRQGQISALAEIIANTPIITGE